MGKRIVLLFSGGLDSTVLLYHLWERGYEVWPITFDYGQKHNQELAAAKKVILASGARHTGEGLFSCIDISMLGNILTSALTDDDLNIPEAEPDHEIQKATVVPNRNMILLSIAAGYAAAQGIVELAYSVHADDAKIYPDCREGFIFALSHALGQCWHEPISLQVPFIHWTKGEIVAEGIRLRVPFELTWSCYKPQQKPCGECGACRARASAFKVCNCQDPLLSKTDA